MPQISRFAFGTFAALCTALTFPASVAAQGDPAATTLGLSVSTFGGWESNISQGTAPDPETEPSAPYGGGAAAINYQTRTPKMSFSTRGSLDYRHYSTEGVPINAISYAGNSIFGADVTRRLNVTASVNTLYSPRFVFSLLPTTGDASTAATPTPLDYGVSAQSTRQVGVGGTATFRVSRRSWINVSASGNRQQLLEEGISVKTTSYGGGYAYGVSRYAKLRLGYTQQESRYPAYGTLPPTGYSHRSFDVGLDYARPLSISRRTSISFGTGSSAIDDGIETFYNVTAHATLRHQLSRTWEANLVYARGMGFVVGFAEPFFADSVNGRAQGQLSRRISMEIGAGYSNGNVGAGSRGDDYISFQANSRIEWIVNRDRIGVYGDYYYYAYTFDATTPALASIPRKVDRNGVRAGLVFRFPLLHERTTRVTR